MDTDTITALTRGMITKADQLYKLAEAANDAGDTATARRRLAEGNDVSRAIGIVQVTALELTAVAS